MAKWPQATPPYRHHRRAKGSEPCFAAIDLGTHNCRMLIARPSDDGPVVIDGFSRIVRLGEGLTHSGNLCEDAIRRTISALRVCAGKIRRHNVVRSRHVATEACRQAINCKDFFRKVHAETGIMLEAIPAEEEATLTLTGCLPLLTGGHSRALMFDIGGGSTELSWIDLEHCVPRPIGILSLPIGVVNLMEKNASPDCSAERFRILVAEIDTLLAPFDAEFGISGTFAREGALMLGTSGTVTTLGAMHLGLARYDRSLVDGLILEFADIERLADRVSAMSCEVRKGLPCIGPERADLMVMGCAILKAITKRWPAGRLRIADRGVREGLLVRMMQEAAKQ
ncbi:MAG: exopolyphosphatase [Rhodospirillales bacterium CG15_BIG_FIL_POST_REV_8_21_14_020_66_15]|nr:MAG: exopolyphosphatase [Rhodospirillales bacterium CG15_BIG_FIL_POST_REV_8_21_14_020_66_15]